MRNRYDATLDRLATGFTEALEAAKWDTGSVLQQTSTFEQVKPTQGPVAYFLVDAMRYEMGDELATRLAGPRRGVDPPGARRAAEHHRHRHGGAHARCRTEL